MEQAPSTYRDPAQAKAHVRAQALARRDGIPAADRARRSDALCERLAKRCDPALGPGALAAAYCAMGSEPDLRAFAHTAFDRGCRVCIPCMLRDGAPAARPRARMAFLEIDRATFDAREAAFLAEPAKAVPLCDPALAGLRAVDPRDIDAIAVPLVAFDGTGNRLGYGGGNYDRFLGALRDDALVVGVAFAEQRLDEVPVEPHDVPLPRIEIG